MSESKREQARQILAKYHAALKERMFNDVIDHAAEFENPFPTTAEDLILRYGAQYHYFCALYSACRPPLPDKKPAGKEPLGKEDFRCFSCGGVIRPKDEACQTCGWTWK